ncbi:hypothetical protein F5H01DRAFT_367348 [Linnemannia elongata]|nr:hypothetical protein F5H01DRAFT_367348 [Linnemannia elongata]
MVNLLLLRPRSAVTTVLLSYLIVSSFVVLSTESVRVRPIASTPKDLRVLSSSSSPSKDQPSLAKRGITTVPHTRPASLPDPQDQEDEKGLLQLQRQRYQQQNQLYDIQPVFVVDQTEFDVYLGVYPDKRPRPLNASAKRRKNKKKKKKKPVLDEQGREVVQQEVMAEPVSVQGRQYLGPVYGQNSLPGFHMAVIEAPWRYRMSYTLDWTVDEDLRERIEEGLTIAEARRQEQMRRYEAATTQPGATVSDERITGPVVEKQRLRVGSELVMDFQLIPLDQVKSNELLLTRVPVSSLQAHIQLRPEVLEGWYRLQIQFWEEPVPSSPDCDLFASSADEDKGKDNGYDKDGKDSDWGEASDSVLLSSPGRLKEDIWSNNCFPRQVGIWRSAEAIEVTKLGPQDLEWEEFIETLSIETRQERWSLAESTSSKPSERTSWEQQKAILREEHLAIEEFREPKPVVVDESGDGGGRWGWELGLGRLSGVHHRIKGFLAHPPWGSNNSNKAATATEVETSSFTADAGSSPVMSSSASSAPPAPPLRRRQDKRTYERTVFPQDAFRYQEFVGPNIKDVIPDFLVQELEQFEDAEMDALEARQERIEQLKKQLKEGGQNNEDVKVEVGDEVIYPMSEWDPEIAGLQELMDVWNGGALLKRDGDVGGDSMQQDEIAELVTDRDDDEKDENEQELIPQVEQGGQARGALNTRIWQGAVETDSQAPVTWRSNRDRIISWRIPQQSPHQTTLLLDIELVATPINPKEQQMTWTREAIAQVALDQQPPVALLTDRVPATWGAVQVTLPAWVPTGTYHVRIRGMSGVGGGPVVEDVSQPFVVLSDPYLYSYS